MGVRDLILFYVVTGISLRWIATAAAAGPSSVVIWIGAWLAFYTPLAVSVVELSSRYPHEGGLYVWSKRAFGDFSGFMSAWTYWTHAFARMKSMGTSLEQHHVLRSLLADCARYRDIPECDRPRRRQVAA